MFDWYNSQNFHFLSFFYPRMLRIWLENQKEDVFANLDDRNDSELGPV